MVAARWWRGVFAPLVLASPFPTPPQHTQDQVSVLELSRAKAKAASEAATPQVLSFFDSVGFREMLKGCCTEVANLTAEELLQRYRAEAQVAELAHALPAPGESIGVFSDVTTTEVGELPWFPNEFEVALMHNRSMSEGAAPINDIAQKEIFGCKPFAGPKPTWTEASSRLIYIAHNMRRLDSGSEPFFGDLTVVFNSSRVKDSVVIAPYDTGLYTMMCLRPEMSGHHKMKKFLPHLNCSAWPVNLPVGTLDYLDHLILPNLAAPVNSSVTNRTILDTARELYTRSGMSKIDYQDVPALDLRSLGGYMESNIMANPRLPEVVKFGIGNFDTLFGTKDGQEVRKISQRFKWPLFWAFGVGIVKPRPQQMKLRALYKLNRRIADPSNIVMTTNASVSSGAVASFEAVWQQAAAVRASRNATDEDVLQWWNSLEQQLQVAPVSADSCARPHDCVAVEPSSKDCICTLQLQNHGRSEQKIFTV
ncbi:unnamed protein product [Durusdinium trenchii]|uniref:Uncharacterized protein n=2 Tax=Durusdinium trenchii TaxID=1381693 RepID=A0ABP0PA41_9DINO